MNGNKFRFYIGHEDTPYYVIPDTVETDQSGAWFNERQPNALHVAWEDIRRIECVRCGHAPESNAQGLPWWSSHVCRL